MDALSEEKLFVSTRSLGMMAKELRLPISAMETLLGMSKNLCNELTDGLIAILGTLRVTGGLLCERPPSSADGISFRLLCSRLVMVSLRCQYL